jgi:hypothetical protein
VVIFFDGAAKEYLRMVEGRMLQRGDHSPAGVGEPTDSHRALACPLGGTLVCETSIAGTFVGFLDFEA